MGAKDQPETSPVDGRLAIVIRSGHESYGSSYWKFLSFDDAELKVGATSWIWPLLRHWAAESAVTPASTHVLVGFADVLNELAAHPPASAILSQPAHATTANDIRRLFRLSEELMVGRDTATLNRGRMTFRNFVLDRASATSFAEEIDAQRVRFKPSIASTRSVPRALISDLIDLSDPYAKAPIGAISAKSARELMDAVRQRADEDLQNIRNACVADLEAGAKLRTRLRELRASSLPKPVQAEVAKAMADLSGHIGRKLSGRLTIQQILVGVLKNIHDCELATANSRFGSYLVPAAKQTLPYLFGEIPRFKSRKIIEAEYRATVEELFAAFHLIHTYVGWNWQSVMELTVDAIDLTSPGVVILQGYKSKTDDDTPVVSIELNEPGIQAAISLLLWNRLQLIAAGFLDEASKALWVTRQTQTTAQRACYFHPITRLDDFTMRHRLLRYSLDQVRTQVLFNTSLQKGGIEAARQRGGHKDLATTDGYVGNVVQDRLSSAFNLEFANQLSKEIEYLYSGGSRSSKLIHLLRPLGDGATCANPSRPPPNRALPTGSCKAFACHAEGGCPNRRIYIDDSRIEETLRTNLYFAKNWNRLWQSNPQRFAEYIAPHIAFNSALLLALERGPYGARVEQVRIELGLK